MKTFRNYTAFFILILLFAACSGGQKQAKNKSVEMEPDFRNENGILLFDGKTFDGWEITPFGTEGPVMISEGKIILNYGDGCTGITYKNEFPKINYQVSLEARKTSGNDFFCGMTFPVNDKFCSLIVGGWGGPVVGLSCIDGNDAANNDTKILKRFDKDIWYKIKLNVTDKRITAWIDEEKLVDFEIENHQLSIRPEVNLSRPFGICSWITTAELREIRLKEL